MKMVLAELFEPGVGKTPPIFMIVWIKLTIGFYYKKINGRGAFIHPIGILIEKLRQKII